MRTQAAVDPYLSGHRCIARSDKLEPPKTANRALSAARIAISATLVLCSAPTFGQLSGGVSCEAFAGNHTVSCSPSTIVDDAGQLLSTGSADASYAEVNNVFMASTSARSRSGYGNLGVEVDFNHFVSIGTSGSASNSLGFANAAFSDTLSVLSSTLETGTPVSVRVSGVLTGEEATSLTLGSGQYAEIQRNLVAHLVINSQQAMYVGYGSVEQLDGITEISTPNYSFSYLLETAVGETISFQASLSMYLGAGIGGLGVGDLPPVQSWYSGSLASFNSSHTYFDVQTSGVSLVSASGASYAPPVPEPSTYALLLAGLAATALAVKRRTRRKE